MISWYHLQSDTDVTRNGSWLYKISIALYGLVANPSIPGECSPLLIVLAVIKLRRFNAYDRAGGILATQPPSPCSNGRPYKKRFRATILIK